MVGYFANLAFPRLGEVTRCGSLNKTDSIPFGSLLGTVIVERAVDVISLLICIILTAVFEYKRLGNYLTYKIINPLVGKLKYSLTSPLVIIAVILLVVFVFLTVRYLKKRDKKAGKETGVTYFIKELIKGLKSISLPKASVAIYFSFCFNMGIIFSWRLYILFCTANHTFRIRRCLIYSHSGWGGHVGSGAGGHRCISFISIRGINVVWFIPSGWPRFCYSCSRISDSGCCFIWVYFFVSFILENKKGINQHLN